MVESPESYGFNRSDKPNHQGYLEISVSVSKIIHDAVCNFIIENYSQGLVLEDEEDSEEMNIKFYVSPGEIKENSLRKELSDYVIAVSKNANLQIQKNLIEDIDITKIIHTKWEQKYRDSIKPIKIGNILIHPPWTPMNGDAKIDIIIEPKMAFGTGTHETTKLCIIEITKHFKAGQSFFDLGCGSGILSILAAKLGGNRIKGADIDMLSVDNASENCVLNNVADDIEIKHGSIELAKGDQPYNFLVANIIRSTILELFDKIYWAVKSGGIIVLSGLLLEDQKPIEKMLAEFKLSNYKINYDGQWLSVTACK